MNKKSISRRTFVTLSAAMAGAGCSTGRQSSRNRNSRPTVALIGCGGKGRDLSRVVAGFADMVACSDVDRSHAEAFSAGKIPIYEDYRELLEREDVDAILNATPDHWHTAINIDALKSGRHVYGEKPLTLTIDEGRILSKVVRKTGLAFQVGAQQRSGPWFRKAVAIARSGILGKHVTATCHLGTGKAGGPFKSIRVPEGLNWDLWLGQAPKTPYIPQRCHKTFRLWFEYSGGEVTDWGAHHVDIAQWGIGAENTGPIEIEAQGVLDKRKDCYNTAQTFDCTMKFANGNTIRVLNSKENGILFEGERGSVFVSRSGIKGGILDKMTTSDKDMIDRQIDKLYPGRLGIPDQDILQQIEFDKGIWELVKKSHMGNFFNCMHGRHDPISNVYTVHRTISSCHLCNIAIRLGRKLHWNPDKEDFIGDPQASAMITRKQRGQYAINA